MYRRAPVSVVRVGNNLAVWGVFSRRISLFDAFFFPVYIICRRGIVRFSDDIDENEGAVF